METVKLPSGVSIPKMTPEEANRRSYLSKEMLDMMHLSPVGNPVACSGEGDNLVLYYDPARVTETAPELWYRPMMDEHEPVDVIELERLLLGRVTRAVVQWERMNPMGGGSMI